MSGRWRFLLYVAGFCLGLLSCAFAQGMEEREAHAVSLLPRHVTEILTQYETPYTVWSDDGTAFSFRSVGPKGERWIVGDARTGKIKTRKSKPDWAEASAATWSPDGGVGVGLEGGNLWKVDAKTGARTALTSDGEPRNIYAAQFAFGVLDADEWAAVNGPMRPAKGLWSPDGRHFATYRYDQTEAGVQIYWDAAKNGYGQRPEFVEQGAPYPGEANAFAYLVVIDIMSGEVEHYRDIQFETFINPVSANLFQWAADSASLYILREGDGLRSASIDRFDIESGEAIRLFTEISDTYLMLSGGRYPAIWSVLDSGSTLLWYSERDGWGNLYAIDLATGDVHHPVTTGEGVVTSIANLNENEDWVYFNAVGREEGADPYFSFFYRARLDGSGVELLTPEIAHHTISASQKAGVFIDSYSMGLDAPPVMVLRSIDAGNVIAVLAPADVSGNEKLNRKPPQRITLRDADDKYHVYASVFFPSDYDPAQTYPVLDYIYGLASLAEAPVAFPVVASRGFGGVYWHAQAAAEMGFIVFAMDAPGTTLRGRDYSRESYGERHVDSTLRHHVAALAQLKAQIPAIDLSRAGIFGHSGGGFASTRAMLFYPEAYKAAVSSSGAHDLLRLYGPEWGDRYIGAYKGNEALYERMSNTTYADRLEGKLFLLHGEADSEVTIAHTQQLVDALIKADKEFDLLYVPGADHGMMNMDYLAKRRWRYFVEHLLEENG